MKRKSVVGSRLRQAGHIQRLSEERLTKIACKPEEGGRTKRGRPTLRMDNVTRSGK